MTHPPKPPPSPHPTASQKTPKQNTKLPPKTALVKYPENHQVFWFTLETCGFQQGHTGPRKKQSAGSSHLTKPAIRSPAQCQQQSWICTRQKGKKKLCWSRSAAGDALWYTSLRGSQEPETLCGEVEIWFQLHDPHIKLHLRLKLDTCKLCITIATCQGWGKMTLSHR